nr:MAG TPA: hypothetical protein [Caudoviricetes sp.]
MIILFIFRYLQTLRLALYRAVSYLYKPDFWGYPRNFGRFLISVQGVKNRVL